MKHTPLYHAHLAHGGKLVEFAGWAMPLHYSGVLDEYHAVRSAAGLFDVSHMGRIQVEGREALPFLQYVATNNVENIKPFQSQYSMVCNPQGGVRDDIFVYRLAESKFLLCVNASNREKIVTWLDQKQVEQQASVHIEDRSEKMAQLALQGPAAVEILKQELGTALEALKPRHCLELTLYGVSTLVSRTGYTGERGYELYLPAKHAEEVWHKLIDQGQPVGLKPAGLGSRDLLRLDMGYYLYGNDLTEEITPVEARAEWVVGWEKQEFVGHEILRQQKVQGPPRRFVAFELVGKGVPRHGMKLCANGTEIGEVSSGNISPILKKGIGLGYVLPSYSEIGTTFDVDIRGRSVPANVVTLPFYKKPKPTASKGN